MEKKTNTDTRKNIRHPTESKGVEPTYPPYTISLGNVDKKLLNYLLIIRNKRDRLNVRRYSIEQKLPKSNIYDALNRLEREGLVNRNYADNRITRKGEVYLEAFLGGRMGVGSSRLGGRAGDNLSTHNHKFKLKILSNKNFWKNKLEEISSNVVVENRLPNLHQFISTFEDAKIIIGPKQVQINLFGIVSDGVGSSDTMCLSRVLEYVDILKRVGIITEGMSVETGEWARIESELSSFLYSKVDKKYFLELDDGSKFWIDCSSDHLEDETNNKVVRENIDKALNEIGMGNVDLQDIGQIKDSLGKIAELQAVRIMKDDNESEKLDKAADMLNKSIQNQLIQSDQNKETAMGLNSLTSFVKSQTKQQEPQIDTEQKYLGYLD